MLARSEVRFYSRLTSRPSSATSSALSPAATVGLSSRRLVADRIVGVNFGTRHCIPNDFLQDVAESPKLRMAMRNKVPEPFLNVVLQVAAHLQLEVRSLHDGVMIARVISHPCLDPWAL